MRNAGTRIILLLLIKLIQSIQLIQPESSPKVISVALRITMRNVGTYFSHFDVILKVLYIQVVHIKGHYSVYPS